MSSTLHNLDQNLIQIADLALHDASQRAGAWLACRPGCHQCCVGVFAISPLDAWRLQQGLQDLVHTDPARVAAIRNRVHASLQRLAPSFPGDFAAGLLNTTAPAFDDFANDEPCPVLAQDGTCDLYSARPMTCRTFGPPVETQEGIGVCELCFTNADDATIQASCMDTTFLDEEARISATLGDQPTLVALALRGI